MKEVSDESSSEEQSESENELDKHIKMLKREPKSGNQHSIDERSQGS